MPHLLGKLPLGRLVLGHPRSATGSPGGTQASCGLEVCLGLALPARLPSAIRLHLGWWRGALGCCLLWCPPNSGRQQPRGTGHRQAASLLRGGVGGKEASDIAPSAGSKAASASCCRISKAGQSPIMTGLSPRSKRTTGQTPASSPRRSAAFPIWETTSPIAPATLPSCTCCAFLAVAGARGRAGASPAAEACRRCTGPLGAATQIRRKGSPPPWGQPSPAPATPAKIPSRKQAAT